MYKPCTPRSPSDTPPPAYTFHSGIYTFTLSFTHCAPHPLEILTLATLSTHHTHSAHVHFPPETWLTLHSTPPDAMVLHHPTGANSITPRYRVTRNTRACHGVEGVSQSALKQYAAAVVYAAISASIDLQSAAVGSSTPLSSRAAQRTSTLLSVAAMSCRASLDVSAKRLAASSLIHALRSSAVSNTTTEAYCGNGS